MRKYTISLLFILTGLALVLFGLLGGNGRSDYAESVFADRAEEFRKGFNNLIEQVEADIISLRSTYAGQNEIRDTLNTRDYFLNALDSSQGLITLGYFQGGYKVVSKRDGKSLTYAVDSTETLDIVRWQRFENMKLISSWNESFEQEIEKTRWYKRLLNSQDKIIWFDRNSEENLTLDDDDNSIYCGISFLADQVRSVIVFEYSKAHLLKKLGMHSEDRSALAIAKTADGRTVEFKSGAWSKEHSDSIGRAVNQHFQRFIEQNHGMFKFSVANENYWSAFDRYPKRTGIDYSLYTVDNKNLSQLKDTSRSKMSVIAGSLLLAIGIILLAVGKRFFYRRNLMEIPDLKELLEDDENRYLEFKSSLRWDHRLGKVNPELEKVILKTIAAFGNTDGGILLIGVDDDKKIVGLEDDFKSLKKQDSDYYEVHLRNILHKAMGVKYVSKHIRTQFETSIGGKVVCKVRVIAGDEPVFLKFKDRNGNIDEKFFVRSGNSSHEIESIPEINDYINKKYKK